MGNGPSTRSDVADDAFSDDAKAHAATKVQAVARGRAVRKDSQSQKLQGAVMIRTNLPKSWRATDGVPRGLEIEHRRCLAFVGPHLVVFRTRALGLSRERGAADFLIDPSQIDTVGRAAAGEARTNMPLTRGRGSKPACPPRCSAAAACRCTATRCTRRSSPSGCATSSSTASFARPTGPRARGGSAPSACRC